MPVTVPGGMTTTNGPLQGRLSRQQQELYLTQLRELERVANERRARLPVSGALRRRLMNPQRRVATYQSNLRGLLATVFRPWSDAVVLNAQETGTLIRTGYRIIKVLYDSLPGWRVTGNLYLPDGASSLSPVPGVVMFCGHDAVGKANATYQALAQTLAKFGIACLLIDAIGMGERKMVPSTPVEEHRLVGQQLPLVGKSLAELQVRDGQCAIDYLLSRSDINASHIGVTGNSGGGTQAAWVLANDSRVTMAALSCCVHTLLSMCENELWADAEQTPQKLAAVGLDFDDVLATFAPKPLLLVGQQRDYFDERAVRTVDERLEPVYDTAGALDNLRLYMGPGSHGLSFDGRQQIVQWFRRAAFGNDSPVVEPAPTTESEADLRVTATGSVNDLVGARTITQLLRDWADECAIIRGAPTGEVLKARVRTTLNLPQPVATSPHYRVWESYSVWTLAEYPKDWANVYAVETEPHIIVPLIHNSANSLGYPLQPVALGTRALFFVPHDSADQELATAAREPLVNTITAAEPTAPLFALDMRGYGELKPNLNVGANPGNFHAQHADMLGQPMLGRMVHDIIRCLDLLSKLGYIVHLFSRGFGTIPASLAALLHPAVVQVTFNNMLTRWHATARALPDQVAYPQSFLLNNVLLSFDLPDVRSQLPNLTNTNMWGAWGGLGGET